MTFSKLNRLLSRLNFITIKFETKKLIVYAAATNNANNVNSRVKTPITIDTIVMPVIIIPVRNNKVG